MKFKEKLLFAYLIITLCGSAVNGWRSFKLIFTEFSYEFNSNYGDAKAQIVNNSAGDTALNVIINMNEEVRDPSLTFALALESDTGNYTALVNRTVNLCQFLKSRHTEPTLRVVYDDLLKHGNFIKSCPIKKGTYVLTEYRIDEELLPGYIPETNFFVEINLNTPVKYLFKGKLLGKIDKSKGFNNLKMFSLG